MVEECWRSRVGGYGDVGHGLYSRHADGQPWEEESVSVGRRQEGLDKVGCLSRPGCVVMSIVGRRSRDRPCRVGSRGSRREGIGSWALSRIRIWDWQLIDLPVRRSAEDLEGFVQSVVDVQLSRALERTGLEDKMEAGGERRAQGYETRQDETRQDETRQPRGRSGQSKKAGPKVDGRRSRRPAPAGLVTCSNPAPSDRGLALKGEVRCAPAGCPLLAPETDLQWSGTAAPSRGPLAPIRSPAAKPLR